MTNQMRNFNKSTSQRVKKWITYAVLLLRKNKFTKYQQMHAITRETQQNVAS